MAAAVDARNQFDTLAGLQALGSSPAIGPRQAASAQFDTAVPADYHHRDSIEILPVNGSQHWPPGGATRLAVSAEAVLITDLPGPALVRGGRIADRLDERLRLFDAR